MLTLGEPALDMEWVYRLGEFLVLGSGVAAAIMRSGKVLQRFEDIAVQQTKEITELKTDVKELSKVVIDLARQDGRINLIEERSILTGKRVDDMAKNIQALMIKSQEC